MMINCFVFMDRLPQHFIPEILKFLPVSNMVRNGEINQEFRAWSDHSYLIKKYEHIDLILENDILFADPEKDLIQDLVKNTDHLYEKNGELLWCLIQDPVLFAAWDAAQSAAAWDLAESAARSAAWEAACSAARSAATCYTHSARSAISYGIKIYNLTDPGEIGKFCYILAERYILLNLSEIVKICKNILDKEIPDWRDLKIDLELDAENPFMSQFRRLFHM